MQATTSPLRVVFAAALLAITWEAAWAAPDECIEGAEPAATLNPTHELEEDDVSLLSITSQVHTRSHRKERSSAKDYPPSSASAVEEGHAASRSYSQASSTAVGSEEEEVEGEEEAAHTEEGPPREREEEEPPGREQGAPAPPAEVPHPVPHWRRRKRPVHETEEPPLDDPLAEDGDEATSAGAAEWDHKVYSRGRHRVHSPRTEEPATQAPSNVAQSNARTGASVDTALPQMRLQAAEQVRPNASHAKVWSDGVVEAPLPLLITGVLFLAALGAFLLREISERLGAASKKLPEASVTTPPVEPPGAVDSSFLIHVLNSVQSDRNHRACTTDIISKGPPKHEEDSSDDCSTCPRPEKEPESEYDNCEEVLDKLREADWALQIAYLEALHRRKESGGRHQAQQPRTSRRQDVRAQAEALVGSLRASSLSTPTQA